MTEAVHTPLPWKLSPWHVEEGPSAVRSSCKENFLICSTASDDDAFLIVTAVNERPALIARVAELEAALEAIAVAGPLEEPKSNSDVLGYFSDDPDDHFSLGWDHGLYHSALIARAALSTTERG